MSVLIVLFVMTHLFIYLFIVVATAVPNHDLVQVASMYILPTYNPAFVLTQLSKKSQSIFAV